MSFLRVNHVKLVETQTYSAVSCSEVGRVLFASSRMIVAESLVVLIVLGDLFFGQRDSTSVTMRYRVLLHVGNISNIAESSV